METLFSEGFVKRFIIFAIAYCLVAVFYWITLRDYIKNRHVFRNARRIFYRGIVSVLENCSDNNECVLQLEMLYKRLIESNVSLDENIRSAAEMLEDFIFSIDTMENTFFSQFFYLEITSEVRNRSVEVLYFIKERQPFSSLSSKEGNLLNILKHALDTQNRDLASNTLLQLADEIEVLEANLRKQSRSIQKSNLISAVGVILTLFFGLVSFIQFFK